MTSTLDSDCQLALMSSTCACNTSWENLASLRNETAELCYILVIDKISLVNAEAADFSAVLAAAWATVISLWSFSHRYFLLLKLLRSERKIIISDDLFEVYAAAAGISGSRLVKYCGFLVAVIATEVSVR